MFAGEVDLKSWYKPNIDKKILKEFSKRSDLKATYDLEKSFITLAGATGSSEKAIAT